MSAGVLYTVQAEATSEGKLPSLSEMFRRQDDEWTCDVCMVPNKLTATKCVACSSIKPQGLSCMISLLVLFSTRCNIYISRLCYDVSVRLSVRQYCL